jgi:hypothetical protein
MMMMMTIIITIMIMYCHCPSQNKSMTSAVDLRKTWAGNSELGEKMRKERLARNFVPLSFKELREDESWERLYVTKLWLSLTECNSGTTANRQFSKCATIAFSERYMSCFLWWPYTVE